MYYCIVIGSAAWKTFLAMTLLRVTGRDGLCFEFRKSIVWNLDKITLLGFQSLSVTYIFRLSVLQ